MALDKSAAPVAEAPATPPAVLGAGTATTPPAPKVERTAEEKRAHGQVRMHAIIAGYRVGGALAATLGTSAASVKEELHKLAAEVADKIESYSFAE